MQCVWYIRYTIVDIDTPNGLFNSRRVLLISPSLRGVEPASLARGSRRTRQEAARPTPSPLHRSSGFPSPRSSTSKDSRPIWCGSGHCPASLVACRSDASWHVHSAPPSAHKARALCTSSTYVVACAPAHVIELERVQHHRVHVLRQRSHPRRTTRPPQSGSSSRFRAISSQPEPVR
jgi:hypothetical protein